MAEYAVSFLLQRLGNLLIQEAQFLYGVPDQVNLLQVELQRMRRFLRDADSRQEGDERVLNWVAEIRDLAYDAEDAIDTFALEYLKSNPNCGIKNTCRMFSNCGKKLATLHSVGSKISDIKIRISLLTDSLQNHGIHQLPEGGDSSSSSSSAVRTKLRRAYEHVDERNVVGLVENANKLADVLVQQGRRVVSICGMGGLGKTTLAKKVYRHEKVRQYFQHFIWVCISQQWRERDIWEHILRKVNPDALPKNEEKKKVDDKEKIKTDDEIAELLFGELKSKRCLVVLDDIWDRTAWKSLSPAFPIHDEATNTKYLLTSRQRFVVLPADGLALRHEPSLLGQADSWELFRNIAIFPRALDHPDTREFITEERMTQLGQEMVTHCKGLPLAIIALAGVLSTKDYIDEWRKVHETVKSQLRDDEEEQLLAVLGLSYDDLPYYLKPCFLHLGQFPEDYAIPTRRLINLWVAEAIIPPESSRQGENEETLEDIAFRYLTMLTDRYLVQVDKRSSTGRIKSCRMHDHIREMCFDMAEKNNFFQILKLGDSNTDTDFFSSMIRKPTSTHRIRRVSIHMKNFSGFIPLGSEESSTIRCALGFRFDSKSGIQQSLIESMVNSFKMLRVLDLEDIQGFAIPEAIGGLIHLRVLTVNSAWIGVLSESFGNLRFLLTLSLDPYRSARKIPNVIWKMKKLRHLYLPEDCGSDTVVLNFANLNDLQTLRNFPASKSDINDLTTLTNLRKLVIRIPDERSFGTFLGIFLPVVRFKHLQSLSIIGHRGNIDLKSIQKCCPHLKKLKLNKKKLFPEVVD